MANNETSIISPSQEPLLPKTASEPLDYRLEELNSPDEIKKRKMHAVNSLEELLGSRLDNYKKLSLSEIEEKIIIMEGVPTLERQPVKTTENFIIKILEEEKSSEKVNLYLWLLDKIHPDDLDYLMIVNEKNRNKLFLLRDQGLAKKNHR